MKKRKWMEERYSRTGKAGDKRGRVGEGATEKRGSVRLRNEDSGLTDVSTGVCQAMENGRPRCRPS